MKGTRRFLKMPRIRISEQEIYFAVRENKNSSHAPFIFIHGAGDSHLVWNGQLAASARIADSFALDLPGHGRSTGAGRATILDNALVVREFLDGLEIERAILIGHSMGGAIAQTVALEFSERVAGLVLVGTGAKLRVALQFLDGIQNDFENTARLLVENYFAPDALPSFKEKSLRQLLATGSVVTYNDFAACDAFDVRERVSLIAAPTLVLCGRDDKMTPLKSSEFLAQHLLHARLVIIENAGHMVMLEQPEEFTAAVTRWVEGLGDGAKS